jgi:hypothetical protein
MKDIINKSTLGLALSFLFVTAQSAEVGLKTETFDLVFPGGPPGKLVEAIEKASGQKLNVLLPPNLSTSAIPRPIFDSRKSLVLPGKIVTKTRFACWHYISCLPAISVLDLLLLSG